MNNFAYSITIPELIKRPIIREDFDEEWMNKMTDLEISQWDKETYAIIESEGITDFPAVNAAHLSKHIDISILYKIFKDGR
jgi:hypothetical protein